MTEAFDTRAELRRAASLAADAAIAECDAIDARDDDGIIDVRIDTLRHATDHAIAVRAAMRASDAGTAP